MLHLSAVARSPLRDPAGEKLGRVEDVIVRLADGGFPPVTGLRARIGGRELFVPADRIEALAVGYVQLSGETLNLGRFERRPGEVLLREDLLGRKLIDVEHARLVSAHEIELKCVEGWWRVIGINPSRRSHLKRLLPGSAGMRREHEPLLEWTRLEPFVGHVPSSRLTIRHRRLARLHPAQIADLVEAASHEEGEEIIEAVAADRELEADVFEELDDDHQLEFLRERSDEQAARLISRMASDDAADLIAELDQQRREPVLELLPAGQKRRILALLGYNASTAGGLMSPDLLSLSTAETVARALERVRTAEIPAEAATTVYVHEAGGKLVGSLPIVALLRAPPEAALGDVADSDPRTVTPDVDLPELARLMSDFNLTSLPVIDGEGKPVGVITVDDVLEQVVPVGWRWRHRAAQS